MLAGQNFIYRRTNTRESFMRAGPLFLCLGKYKYLGNDVSLILSFVAAIENVNLLAELFARNLNLMQFIQLLPDLERISVSQYIV